MAERNSEEWRSQVIDIKGPEDLPPQHDEEACGQCTFVANRESILVTKEQEHQAQGTGSLRRRENRIVSLGRFTLPRWSGCAMWYLLQCPECDSLSCDYVHGKGYMVCDSCEYRWFLRGKRFYHDAGRQAPLSWFAEMLELWRLRRRLQAEFPDGL